MRRGIAAAGIGIAVFALQHIRPADAAVRRCGALISSDVMSARDELASKKKALDQWRERAKAQGTGLDSWRLATGRALKCFPGTAGGFDCMAVGSPCTIQQNPRQQPAGADGKGVGL